MHRFLALCVLITLAACRFGETSPSEPPAATSDIAQDETLVFFRTAGWLDEDAGEWHLPVHGWVYEQQDSSVRKALFEAVLEEIVEQYYQANITWLRDAPVSVATSLRAANRESLSGPRYPCSKVRSCRVYAPLNKDE